MNSKTLFQTVNKTIIIYNSTYNGVNMKNTFGNNISVTLFGESHGEAIGAVLDGMPAGIKIDIENIEKRLTQ